VFLSTKSTPVQVAGTIISPEIVLHRTGNRRKALASGNKLICKHAKAKHETNLHSKWSRSRSSPWGSEISCERKIGAKEKRAKWLLRSFQERAALVTCLLGSFLSCGQMHGCSFPSTCGHVQEHCSVCTLFRDTPPAKWRGLRLLGWGSGGIS
jgi:hypothetical protein